MPAQAVDSARWTARTRLLGYGSDPYEDPVWVYVRAESGAEGWVSHEYLEWD